MNNAVISHITHLRLTVSDLNRSLSQYKPRIANEFFITKRHAPHGFVDFAINILISASQGTKL